jgi:signal transduction histidine kinase
MGTPTGSLPMDRASPGAALAGLRTVLGPRRIAVMLLAAVPLALLISIDSETRAAIWIARCVIVGTGALVAFGLAESMPARLPRWLGRWVFQLLAMAVAIPISAYVAYWITTGGDPAFMANPKRFVGFGQITIAGLLFGVWLALGAMVRQRDARVHAQTLAFERERRELERQAIEARTQLLRSQIQPHFLFNTLANIQALVEAGSPHAPQVLASLIAYLKAAVPQLDETASTLGREVELVRAYLELMRMRMPDRLRFTLDVDPSVLSLRCPPTTLLTLVENAVRHGIDPAEEGGEIEVAVKRRDGDVLIRVEDSGVGPGGSDSVSGAGTGSGLRALRERLALAFGEAAALRLFERQPHGFTVEVQFPAEAR